MIIFLVFVFKNKYLSITKVKVGIYLALSHQMVDFFLCTVHEMGTVAITMFRIERI